MCAKHGKLIGNYSQMQATKDYLKALGASIGNPIDGFVITKTNVPNAERGTWVHPRVAIDLARWCSPSFAVWVDGWVHDWMRGQPPVAAAPALDMTDPLVLAERYIEAERGRRAATLQLTQVTTEKAAAVKEAKVAGVELSIEKAHGDRLVTEVAVAKVELQEAGYVPAMATSTRRPCAKRRGRLFTTTDAWTPPRSS
ncbi:MAG: KilA-N domain-containing protein [Verrucomicrobiota bacterium]